VVGFDLNPGMLAVARALAPPLGGRIEWREGSVTAIPFADATFDLAVCQQGLQFFPDRFAALGEIHRVLVSDGRMTVGVWRPIDYSPGFDILARALGDNIGAEAAAFMQGPFGLGSAEELRGLIIGSGFRDVLLRSASKVLRFPSPEGFVRRYIAATPLASVVAQATEDARNALIAAVTIALQPYVDPEGLAFPIEDHFAMAHA
jgi:SAM-dependent methyltransferase